MSPAKIAAMFNHIYGSPFPVINPKIRYKTALERAGFDTNFHDGLMSNQLPPERRNVSTGSGSPARPNDAQQTRIMSLPGMNASETRSSPSALPVPARAPQRPRPTSAYGRLPTSLNELPRQTNGGPPQKPYSSNTSPRFAQETPVANMRYETKDVGEIRSTNGGPNKSDGNGNYGYLDRTEKLNVGNSASIKDYNALRESDGEEEGNNENRKEAKSDDRMLWNDKPVRDSKYPFNSLHSSQPSGASSSTVSKGPGHEQKMSAFDFEIAQPPPTTEIMNPIERSYMMLTQKSSFSSERSLTDSNSVHTAAKSLEEDAVLSAVSELHIPSVTKEDFSDSGRESDDNECNDMESDYNKSDDGESINFEPCAELNISLSSDQKAEHLHKNESMRNDSEHSSKISGLKLATQFDDALSQKSAEKAVGEIEDAPFKFKRPVESPVEVGSQSSLNSQKSNIDSANGTYASSPNKNKYRQMSYVGHSSLSNEDSVSTPQTATNLQVEKLLAQLNDVSEHKNAQVDSFPVPSPNGTSDERTAATTESRSALHVNAGNHYKKSSAFLSGFPTDNAPQSITIDDDNMSSTGVVGDTPLFYNFKQHKLKEFGDSGRSPREASLDEASNTKNKLVFRNVAIEPLQLKYKTAEEIEEERIRRHGTSESAELQPSTPRATSAAIENVAHSEKQVVQERSHKYPPGEGPCRLCGLEVTQKPIFSKKDNELSGQWHRNCFRCLKCNIRFSKQTPCYIFDDEPYCQQHYHEKNNSICKICNGFIEGECLENDRNERFHVNCLTCFLCKTVISNDYFIYNEEFPLCGHHDVESLMENEDIDLNGKSNLSRRRTRLINFSQS